MPGRGRLTGRKEVAIDRLLPGSIFGELAVLDDGARVRTVRATELSELGRIPGGAFNAWLLEHRRWPCATCWPTLRAGCGPPPTGCSNCR